MKDKETIKKNQHYVFQRYLKSWKGETYVWTLFLDNEKIERRNTTSVAKENYFYKLTEITSKEVSYIDTFIRKESPNSLKEMQLNNILGVFVEYTKLKQEYGNRPTDVEQAKLKKLEANYFENIHERIENLGIRLIECESFKDFEDIFHNWEERHKAIAFLMAQYYRTKKMKELIESTDSSFLDFSNSNIWTILSFVLAQNMSVQTSCLSANFVLLENNTQERFLTSDQPVINLSIDESSQKIFGNCFYYPITPIYSIIIDSQTNDLENQGVFSTTTRTLTLNEVREYNEKIICSADKLVFSENEYQLRKIMAKCRRNNRNYKLKT